MEISNMSWSRLCGSNELPKNSMVMRHVGNADVLVVNVADVIYALLPFCLYMPQALGRGNFAACFEGEKPACNKYRNAYVTHSGGPAGVAGTGPKRYLTKTVDDDIYVDVDALGPVLEFEHATCSPAQTGTDTACLLVNLWERGFDNKTVRVLSTKDGA